MYPDAGVFEFRLSFDGPKMTLDADPLDRQLHYLDGERGWLHPCTLVWPRQRLDTNMGRGTGWRAPRAARLAWAPLGSAYPWPSRVAVRGLRIVFQRCSPLSLLLLFRLDRTGASIDL